MTDDDFDAPIKAVEDGYRLALSDDESDMVRRLVAELRDMVGSDEPDGDAEILLTRLFPVTHPDDPDAEAEYQRLMRDELVQSKQAAFETVDTMLSPERAATTVSAGELVALMQSINSVRLVLGTMLKVSDDPDAPEVMPGFENSREYHLYGYLSWLLEWAVRALSGQA